MTGSSPFVPSVLAAVLLGGVAPPASAVTPRTHLVRNASIDAFAAFVAGPRAFFMQGNAPDLARTAPPHVSKLAGGTATRAGTRASASNPSNPPGLSQMTVSPFGSGRGGAVGFAPALARTGSFLPGSQGLLARIRATGGPPELVLFGLQPAALPLGNGRTLNVAPSPPIVFGPALSTGQGPGNGRFDASFTLPLTSTPGSLSLQAFVDEGGGLFANSNGSQLTIP